MDRFSFLAFAAAFPVILSAQNVLPDFDHAPFHVLTIEDHSENENLEFKIRAAVFARIPSHESLLVEKIEFPKEFREPIQLISPFDPIADSSVISLTEEGVEGSLILDTRDGWTSFSLRTKSNTAPGDLLGMLKFDGKTRNGEAFSFRLMNLRGGEARPDTGEKDLAKSAMFHEHRAFEAVGDPEKNDPVLAEWQGARPERPCHLRRLRARLRRLESRQKPAASNPAVARGRRRAFRDPAFSTNLAAKSFRRIFRTTMNGRRRR